MSDSLDNKLREILKDYYWAIEGSIGGEPEFAVEVNNDFALQIKQAFIDKGWVSADDMSETDIYMRGQTFYDGFSQQFRGTPGGTIVTLNIDEVMRAAKKAAGLE